MAPAMPESATPREWACSVTAKALRGRALVTREFDALRRRGALRGAFDQQGVSIALGALRRLLTIDHILAMVGRYESVRVSHEARATLACAAFEIIWQEIAPGVVVDAAVDIARRSAGARAAGMVNALLRRVSDNLEDDAVAWRAGDARLVRIDWDRARRFRREIAPADADARLAALVGETPARVKTMRRRFGAKAEAALWAGQAQPPLVLQRNALRVTREAFAEGLRAALGARGEVDLAADAVFVRHAGPLLGGEWFRDGAAYAQDVTATQAADFLGASAGERVLDLCAAPGGKSLRMAIASGDRAEIVACDIAAERVARIRENAARLGICGVRAEVIDAERDTLPAEVGAGFDAALVDAPCSNSGVLARRPEARLRLMRGVDPALPALQLRLLRQAASAVRAGGRLVYSTCSIEEVENEAIVQAFLRDTPGWALAEQRLTLPAWGARLSDWRDGGFAALMRRG